MTIPISIEGGGKATHRERFKSQAAQVRISTNVSASLDIDIRTGGVSNITPIEGSPVTVSIGANETKAWIVPDPTDLTEVEITNNESSGVTVFVRTIPLSPEAFSEMAVKSSRFIRKSVRSEVQELDAQQLVSALDAAGNNISNIGAAGVDSITASNEITDAAGVSHTGELADASDLNPRRFSYDPGHTQWSDGLTNEEVNRLVLQSGVSLTVERIEFRQKGGGGSTNASLRVYDVTAGAAIGSADLGTTVTDPGSSGDGNTVIADVSNSTGGPIDAVPRVLGRIQQ